MKWSKTYSRRAGTLIAIFGIANIAGTLFASIGHRSLEFVVPGLVIGGAGTAVGVKRGFPIVPTPHQKGLSDGLATIRARGWRLAAIVVVWLLTAPMILPHLPEQAITTAFFVSVLPAAWAHLTWVLSGCPRCGEHFYTVGTFRGGRSPMSRCQHCGLKMRGGQDGRAESRS